MGFFERNEMGEGYEGEVDENELITDAEPGTFEELPYGVKLSMDNQILRLIGRLDLVLHL